MNPRIVAGLTLLLPRLAAAQVPVTPDDQRLIAAARRVMPEILRVYGVPGIELAVARRGRVIWQDGFGYADIGRMKPMTAETVFRTGSMGKTYTATAVMQLVEQGVLSLDAPINSYLRRGAGFEVKNPLGDREITVRDLLTHRGGMTSDGAGSELTPPAPLRDYLRAEYGKTMLYGYDQTGLPLWGGKVGEKYQYSNIGVATLGLLVELVNPEHLSYEAYVQRHVFEPLGMTSTQFPALPDSAHLRPELATRRSVGYAKIGDVDLPTPQLYLGDYPAGTSFTTPGDHIRLLLAYLNGGMYEGHQILKPETVKLMLTEGASANTGLIWRLWNSGKPDFVFGHGGAYMFGWRNEFRAFPDLDLAIVVASNQWDMMSPRYGFGYQAAMDFVVNWVRHEKEGLRHPQADASWAWKLSYVTGLVWVDQLKGGLGTHSVEAVRASIETIAREAHPRSANSWDAGGFRAGAEDMLRVPMQPDSIRAFLSSDRLRVYPEELNLIYAALGGTDNWVPWPEFVRPQ